MTIEAKFEVHHVYCCQHRSTDCGCQHSRAKDCDRCTLQNANGDTLALANGQLWRGVLWYEEYRKRLVAGCEEKGFGVEAQSLLEIQKAKWTREGHDRQAADPMQEAIRQGRGNFFHFLIDATSASVQRQQKLDEAVVEFRSFLLSQSIDLPAGRETDIIGGL